MTILGTVGDDTLAGTTGNDVFDLTQGGNDHASGLAGADTFQFGPTFDAGDFVSGGEGDDTVSLKGNYADGLSVTSAMITSVEKFVLAKGFSYALTLDNSAVSIGHTMKIDASTLQGGNFVYLDATAETTSRYVVTAGKGNDLVYGGAANDDLDLSPGGNDEVHGGAGDDTIRFGASLGALDIVDGGAGKDTLVLIGDYSGLNALSSLSLTDVETLKLSAAPGNGYDITIGDDNIPSGGSLRIDSSGIAILHQTVLLDISQVDGTAGARIVLLGGVGDEIVLAGGNLVASDRLDGGDGDDILDFGSDTEIVFNNGTVRNFDWFHFAGGHDFRITLASLNIAAGTSLEVDAQDLGADDSLFFDAHQAKTGRIAVAGGAGDDVVSGGLGNDTFDLSLGGDDTVNGGRGDNLFIFSSAFRVSDSVDGGSDAGFNTVILTGNYTGVGLAFTATTMKNIDRLELQGAGDYQITLAAETVAVDQTFTLDTSGVAVANLVTFSAEHSLGTITLTGHDGTDVFYAGQTYSTLMGMGGNDVLYLQARPNLPLNPPVILLGGDGYDTIVVGSISPTASRLYSFDKVDGGNGGGMLILGGDYSAGLTFSATTVTNIGTIQMGSPALFGGVAESRTYKLTTHDATVAAGQTLTVDGSFLSTVGANTGTLDFNGSAETNGTFSIQGGHGNDTLRGGALGDSIIGSDGDDIIFGNAGADFLMGNLGIDTLTGGSGNDTFSYGASAIESGGMNHDVITDMDFSNDKIDLQYTITTIDAAATGAVNSASFDADLTAALAASLGGLGHAILLTANSGTLSGHKFLVIDHFGTAGYQSGADWVIEVTGAIGTLTTATFI